MFDNNKYATCFYMDENRTKNYHYRGTYDKKECITVLYIIGTSNKFIS